MKRVYILRLIIWIVLSVVCLPDTWALERRLDIAQLVHDPQSLTTLVGKFEDTSQSLTLEALRSPEMVERFQYDVVDSAAFALGFTRSAYWFRLHLANTSDQALKRLLVVDNPRISFVDVYVTDEQGRSRTWSTGADRPALSKAYANRNFVFPLELPAHTEQVIHVRVQSSIGLLVPLQLWSVDAFQAYERDDYMARSAYVGIAIAMILFNLMLFIALRDRIYLLYVTFVLCTVCALTVKNGMAPGWLLFGLPLNGNVTYYSSASFALCALMLFMRQMLQTRHTLPWADRLLLAMIALYLITPVIYDLALPQVARMAILFNLLTALAIFAIALACALKRQRSAYFFLGAFGLLILGGATTTLRAMGVLPTNVFTVDGLQLGSSLEMLLLAFALADRINVMRQEKMRTQAQLLQTQAQLVETLQRSERELEQRVQERTQELQQLNQRLENLSVTDALTNIGNRRQFDAELTRQWRQAQRNATPLALAIMDVDWFKAYNDLYGHPAGDACLRQIAQTLVATLARSTDFVARYGGEEFVFLAPGTELAGALQRAEKLIAAMATLNLAHSGSPYARVTLSIGVAAMQATAGGDPQQLLQRADAALYRAKQGGRNRVECDQSA